MVLQKESLLSSFLAVEKKVARRHHLHGPRGWNFETKGGAAQVISGNIFVGNCTFHHKLPPPLYFFKDAMVLNNPLQHGKEPLKDTSGSKREGNSSLQ